MLLLMAEISNNFAANCSITHKTWVKYSVVDGSNISASSYIQCKMTNETNYYGSADECEMRKGDSLVCFYRLGIRTLAIYLQITVASIFVRKAYLHLIITAYSITTSLTRSVKVGLFNDWFWISFECSYLPTADNI